MFNKATFLFWTVLAMVTYQFLTSFVFYIFITRAPVKDPFLR
jgi:hypothetical protein